MKTMAAWTFLACLTFLGLSACGDDDSTSSSGTSKALFEVPDVPVKTTVGKKEGKLSIVVWPGYAEDGSTDPKVDWVTPFERASGCNTTVKVANTSDEMITLMRTGRYDGVSASGNASVKMIAGGDVAPIDPKILEHWDDLSSTVKMKDYNSVEGKLYGAPHGYGANLLM